MIEYTDAPEVKVIADEIIKAHHPHLEDEEIDYVFRDKAANKGSKTILGMARKMRGLVSFLSRDTTDTFFVMEIALDTWKTLTDEQKNALVDHELCHFGVDDEGNRFIIPHDLEEFAVIIERHGIWSQGIGTA